jgi:WD40 repeat protein
MPVEQLNRAIALIKSGQKESARDILTQLVRAEPGNDAAWLWLAESMPNDNWRIGALEAGLKVNPQSPMLRRGLERLRERHEFDIKPPISSDTPETEDVDNLRQVLAGKAQSSMMQRLRGGLSQPETQIREQLEPITEDIDRRQQKPGEARKLTARQRRQILTRGLVLLALGLFAAAAVGFTAYIMRDQLRAWLGLPGGTPTIDSRALTPGGGNLSAQSPTQSIPTATLTPTPTVTPVPTPTATVAFSFSYSGIAPENAAQVIQVGEFASIPARCVAISSNNLLLAAGMEDASVFVWEIATGSILHIFEGHTQRVNAVAFSPDNRFLVSGSEDGTVRVWDLDTEQEVNTLVGHTGGVRSVAFSPDGHTFASGSVGGGLFLWQLGVNTAINTLPVDAPVTSADFSPDGRRLVVGLETGAVKMWDVATGSLLNTLLGHSGAVNCVEFAPGGHRMVTGSADKTVKLWDVDTGKVLYTIGSHTDAVLSVSFSPDGRIVASASSEQTIKLWEVAGRREIATLRHARNMPVIAFSPDGRVLAAALSPTNPKSNEGGVAIWGVLYESEDMSALEPLAVNALEKEKWVPGARMAISHAAHQSVAVIGGRVLIIGGGSLENPVSFTHKVELYNPASGVSLLTGGLNTARGSFSASLLRDGRVLVIGGNNASDKWVTSVEIYDPVSGAWSLSQPLYNHGTGHTATLLVDGRVLLVGGCAGDGMPGRTNRTELFDPATNSWADAGVLGQSRCGHIAALLTNGRVLVAGGENGERTLSSSEVFDPVTGQWSPTGDLNVARSEAVAVQLRDGRVMITGGLSPVGGNSVTRNDVEIYDENLGEWEQAAPMLENRYGHTVNLLPGGLVLVVGGLEVVENDTKRFMGSVDVYDPEEDTWTPVASTDEPRAYHTATLLTDGRIFVAGGMSAETLFLASTEILVVSKPPIYEIPTPFVWDTRTPTITPAFDISATITGTITIETTPTPETPSGGNSSVILPVNVSQHLAMGIGDVAWVRGVETCWWGTKFRLFHRSRV